MSAFKVTVLTKLESIIQNQQEQLTLLRQIAASSMSTVDAAIVLDDVLPQRLNSIHELEELNASLATSDFRKKLVTILCC